MSHLFNACVLCTKINTHKIVDSFWEFSGTSFVNLSDKIHICTYGFGYSKTKPYYDHCYF